MGIKITVQDTGNSSNKARTLSQSILNLIQVTECTDFEYTYKPAQTVTIHVKDPAAAVRAAEDQLRRAQQTLAYIRG